MRKRARWPWPLMALACVLCAAPPAAVLGGLALGEESAAEDELAGSPPWQERHDAMESRALAADVLLGVAAAAAVGTLVLFLVGRDHGEGEGDDGPAVGLAVAPFSVAVSF